MIHQDLRRSHLIALDEQSVLAGLELQVVTQMQGGDDHAHVQRELAADGADAGEQVAALFLVHQRDEAVAHFQFQGIQRQQGLHFFRRIGRGALALALALALGPAFGFLGLFFVPGRDAGGDVHEARKDEEGQGGQAGHQREDHQHAGDQLEGAAVEGELGKELFAHLGFGGRAGNQQTRAGGDDDGRDGGDQTVTDGQQRVGGEGRIPVHILMHDADDDAADEVHQRDEHAGVHVPGHEFTSTVHGAVEVGFLAQGVAALRGFLFADEAGVEVGFDGHLLAGHGVKGEAGRHFRDARGTGGDDDLVQDEQDHEDDAADHIAAADHEFAEGTDHFPGGFHAHVPVEQDETGGRHVERQPQQSGHQQQRREDGELQRGGHEHGGYEDEQRDGDAHAEHDVQKERRQRHQHDKEDDHHAQAEHDVALFGKATIIKFGKID